MPHNEERDKIFRQLHALKPANFPSIALEVFRYQARHNALYSKFLSLLGVTPGMVNTPNEIPFLPISFFKTHDIRSGTWTAQTTFTSSGTSGQLASRHLVRHLDFYLRNTVEGFQQQYGAPSKYTLLALLPSYLERSASSLVHMARHFIQLSGQPHSGFFLHNMAPLVALLRKYEAAGAKAPPTILLGVSFALLDLVDSHTFHLPHLIVMETGGMKGRRAEPTRGELHAALQKGFGVPVIHSEYGMTELFSQAYSKSGGLFHPAATLRAFVREITDPRCIRPPGKSGVLNFIDLANVNTCSFIATDDLGRVYEDGSFEVLGRLDNSDLRGCNLMAPNSPFASQ